VDEKSGTGSDPFFRGPFELYKLSTDGATSTPSFDAISLKRCCRDSSSCVHSQSLGLLQRSAVRRFGQVDASSAVSPERGRSTCNQCEHITPILRQLHWLPVRQRVLFKTAVLVFQCLAGQAPSYLSDDCQRVSHSRPRRLRSSDSLTCVVRRAHNTYGDRCFATAGPRGWNSLPIELQQCDSLGRFKRCLKIFLVGSWNYGAL